MCIDSKFNNLMVTGIKNRNNIKYIPIHMYMYIGSSYRNVIIGIIIIGISIDIASIVVSR